MIGFHNSQYGPGSSTITRTSGCTWTTLSTGIAVVTAGRYEPTPDQIHNLVKRYEETSPASPGWSLQDADLAMARFAMARFAMQFEVHSGQGWAAVEKAHAEGRFLVIQGDSDQFGNGTCSGAFDGNHCIGASRTMIEAGIEYWWINDPICPTGRWERKNVIRRYAEKLNPNVYFGYFVQKIPAAAWRWTCEPPLGQKTRSFRQFYVDSRDHITGGRRVRTAGMAVACTAPKLHRGINGEPDRELVQLLAPGKTRDHWFVIAHPYAKEIK